MVKENYLINEAAKEVHVESHVLRYWEEELNLPIRRNVQGHRIYTKEDIDKFIRIKKLKDQGLQLKAVKKVMDQNEFPIEEHENFKHNNPFLQKQLTKINKNGEMRVVNIKAEDNERWKRQKMIEIKEKRDNETKLKETQENQTIQAEKIARMQYLLQKYMQNTLEMNNEVLIKEISEKIKQDVCKELDYQFRLIQEQEDQRLINQEEHYKKIDELLRTTIEKNKNRYILPGLRKKTK